MVMDKTKLLTYTVIALLVLNFGTLGFLFVSGPKGHSSDGHGPDRKPMPREIIIEKLHFDEEQVKKYDQLINWHRTTIDQTEDKIRAAKNKLYLLLNENPVNEKSRDSLINALSAYQKEIEETHFKHFGDIKRLCKKDQMDDFKKLTDELSGLFSKPHKRRND